MWSKKNQGEIIVAVEIGSAKTVAAVGELQEDGKLQILGFGEAPSAGIRKGEVVEFHLARQSVSDALIDAENNTDCKIREVYLAVGGDHYFSRNVKVAVNIDDEDEAIDIRHIEALKAKVDKQPVPADCKIISAIHQGFYLDDMTRTDDPIGCHSHSLTGTYHLVFGQETKLTNEVRTLSEQGITCRGLLVSGFASSQSVLANSPERKQLGAVVIDMGAGTTDFCAYIEGRVVLTGSIGVGGDHLTQDMCYGLKIPFRKAEDLKRSDGSVSMTGYDPDEQVVLERDISFEGRAFYQETLVQILEARQREILELVYAEIDEAGIWNDIAAGVFLTGGASRMRGLREIANDVFGHCPVALIQGSGVDGDQKVTLRADMSTVLGLLRFAHNQEYQDRRRRPFKRMMAPLSNLLASVRLFNF